MHLAYVIRTVGFLSVLLQLRIGAGKVTGRNPLVYDYLRWGQLPVVGCQNAAVFTAEGPPGQQ